MQLDKQDLSLETSMAELSKKLSSRILSHYFCTKPTGAAVRMSSSHIHFVLSSELTKTSVYYIIIYYLSSVLLFNMPL